MKNILLPLMSLVLLSACSPETAILLSMKRTSNSGSPIYPVASSPSIQDPATPATPTAPATTAPTLQWPPTNAVKVSTMNSKSCAILPNGVTCTDGATTITPGAGLSSMIFTDVVVNDTMACVLQEPAGPAVDCIGLNDPSCTAPATNNVVYCWNFSDFSVTAPDEGSYLGFAPPTYSSGAKAISISGPNICITQTIYLNNGAFVQNSTACGTTANGAGYLE